MEEEGRRREDRNYKNVFSQLIRNKMTRKVFFPQGNGGGVWGKRWREKGK